MGMGSMNKSISVVELNAPAAMYAAVLLIQWPVVIVTSQFFLMGLPMMEASVMYVHASGAAACTDKRISSSGSRLCYSWQSGSCELSVHGVQSHLCLTNMRTRKVVILNPTPSSD